MGTKKPKLTKKMLNNLDKAEIRTIIMTAMDVKPEQAYQATPKWCVDHIYDNQIEFAQADLTGIPVKKFRNLGVFNYVRGLQGYLQGSVEAPSWPPSPDDMDNAEALVETTTEETGTLPLEEPVQTEVKIQTPEKIDLKVAKGDISEEEIAEVDSEETNALTQRGMAMQTPTIGVFPKKVAFKKIKGLGNTDDTSETLAVSGISREQLDESLKAMSSQLSLDNDLRARKTLEKMEGLIDGFWTRYEARNNQLQNALLFIINSAILPEGNTIETLEEIPTPPYK